MLGFSVVGLKVVLANAIGFAVVGLNVWGVVVLADGFDVGLDLIV